MAQENKLLVYERYSEILDGIFVYQDQQEELREMCLKILLGTFALVGGLLFAKVEISSQSLLIMNALFPFLSLIIISVNLIMDLVYKERLRLAFISEALRLEKAHTWLPQFHIPLKGERKKSRLAADGQIIYYLGSAALLMLISAISISMSQIFTSILSRVSVFVIYILLYIIYQFAMSRIVKKTEYFLEAFNNE